MRTILTRSIPDVCFCFGRCLLQGFFGLLALGYPGCKRRIGLVQFGRSSGATILMAFIDVQRPPEGKYSSEDRLTIEIMEHCHRGMRYQINPNQ